ncbi:hypothetical protein ACFE04_017559 [Oxalis oulophora]
MGFPVGYTELLPKLLLHTLSLLTLIRLLISSIFKLIGFHDFLQPDIATWPNHHHSPPSVDHPFPSLSALLIRELIPVVRFSDLLLLDDNQQQQTDSCCAVCLLEFEDSDEIRRLTNCRHIFHRSCIDRWIVGYDQKTCPLCRTSFIPDDMQESFNERLWAASGIPEFYGDYSGITDL